MAEDAAVILSQYDSKARTLGQIWNYIRSGILRSERAVDIQHYSIAPGQDESNCIRFQLFGAPCYVAFSHDLTCGCLEYGVLDPLSPEDRPRRIVVARMQLDDGGRLEGGIAPQDVSSVIRAHLGLVASKAPQLLSAFAEAHHGARESRS